MSEYAGVDRRGEFKDRRVCDPQECDSHIKLVMHEKIDACKVELYRDIHELKEDVSEVNKRLTALTGDVHKLGIAVTDIAINSKSIAASLESMSGMVETYKTLVGINKLFGWMRENIIGIAMLIAIFMVLSGKIDLKMLLGWLV